MKIPLILNFYPLLIVKPFLTLMENNFIDEEENFRKSDPINYWKNLMMNKSELSYLQTNLARTPTPTLKLENESKKIPKQSFHYQRHVLLKNKIICVILIEIGLSILLERVYSFRTRNYPRNIIQWPKLFC